VKREDLVLPEYLNLFIKRDEFARKCWFEAIGSARNYFRVPALAEFDIELPDLPTQQKYVDIYKAMVANQQCYERGLEDLKLVCDGYIEDLRRKHPCEAIAGYIQQRNERNSDKALDFVMGLSTKKEFREAQSRVNRDELGNYKIVNPYDIAFVPTTDTWKVLAFAVNRFDKPLVVSPIYEVFSVDQTRLLSQYLAIWLTRQEFDRYARYHSWGSARENFSFEDMQNVEIPIPEISIQQSVVDIYNAYIMRREINERLKAQIKNICPILIKGSLEEGRSNG
jgi:type I restriction enzyme S subunit